MARASAVPVVPLLGRQARPERQPAEGGQHRERVHLARADVPLGDPRAQNIFRTRICRAPSK
eukprot:11315545-Alexandrium_andersonii.AAC.1